MRSLGTTGFNMGGSGESGRGGSSWASGRGDARLGRGEMAAFRWAISINWRFSIPDRVDALLCEGVTYRHGPSGRFSADVFIRTMAFTFRLDMVLQ